MRAKKIASETPIFLALAARLAMLLMVLGSLYSERRDRIFRRAASEPVKGGAEVAPARRRKRLWRDESARVVEQASNAPTSRPETDGVSTPATTVTAAGQ